MITIGHGADRHPAAQRILILHVATTQIELTGDQFNITGFEQDFAATGDGAREKIRIDHAQSGTRRARKGSTGRCGRMKCRA